MQRQSQGLQRRVGGRANPGKRQRGPSLRVRRRPRKSVKRVGFRRARHRQSPSRRRRAREETRASSSRRRRGGQRAAAGKIRRVKSARARWGLLTSRRLSRRSRPRCTWPASCRISRLVSQPWRTIPLGSGLRWRAPTATSRSGILRCRAGTPLAFAGVRPYRRFVRHIPQSSSPVHKRHPPHEENSRLQTPAFAIDGRILPPTLPRDPFSPSVSTFLVEGVG